MEMGVVGVGGLEQFVGKDLAIQPDRLDMAMRRMRWENHPPSIEPTRRKYI